MPSSGSFGRRPEVVLKKLSEEIKREYTEWFVPDDDEEDGIKVVRMSMNLKKSRQPTPKVKKENIEVDSPQVKPEPVDVELSTKKKTVMLREDFLNRKFRVKFPKKLDVDASFRTVFTRLDDLNIKPFPIDRDSDFLDSTITRQFFSKVYGGNTQVTWPTIAKKFTDKHGMKNFMFLSAEWNPQAPQRSGYSGLFYECFLGTYPDTLRAFVRLKANHWLFLGLYRLVLSSSLTREEWSTVIPEAAKVNWCKEIAKRDWGKSVCKQVALRKLLGREPTEGELRLPCYDTIGNSVAPEDIRADYDSGKELLYTWAMKCVGYDEAFQQRLIDGYSAWKAAQGLAPDDEKRDDEKDKKLKVEPKDEKAKKRPKDEKMKMELKEEKVKKESNSGSVKREPKEEDLVTVKAEQSLGCNRSAKRGRQEAFADGHGRTEGKPGFIKRARRFVYLPFSLLVASHTLTNICLVAYSEGYSNIGILLDSIVGIRYLVGK